MGPFSAESTSTPAQLQNVIYSAARNTPLMYLYLTEEGGVPVVCTMHCPSKYAATLGLVMPWDDQCFMFLTDVSGGMVTTVEWPGTGGFNHMVMV